MLLGLLFIPFILIASCTSAVHVPGNISTPSIEASSEVSLLDQDVTLIVNKLNPFEIVSIQAESIDDNGMQWLSCASFQANSHGVINLSEQAPLDGSYSGIDPIGLLWSMQPQSGDSSSFKIKQPQFSVTFKAFRGQQEIASKEIIRLRKSPEIKMLPVRENGLVGILFLPPSEKILPVIITLSGSNGGLGENRAQLLASHGFAVLALGYFGVEGLPSNLQDIPLEYFETAFNWLQTQPNLDSTHVGIYGASRGAELSLILGAWFPESVQAIVAAVPSSVIYGGLSETTPIHAWRYKGEPLAPFAPVSQTNSYEGKGDDAASPASDLEGFLEGMKDKDALEAAAIPVEKIQAALLLISGGDDQMWPSTLYAKQIEERLQKHASSIVCEHLHYPKAGHGINIPNLPQPGPLYYHPIAKKWFTMGGSIADDQYASQDSWKKLIAFFEKELKNQESNE